MANQPNRSQHVINSQHHQFVREFVQNAVAKLGVPPPGKSVKSIQDKAGCALFFGRRDDGVLYAGVEFYVPESYDDDDASLGGYLPSRPGMARTTQQAEAPSIEELLDRL